MKLSRGKIAPLFFVGLMWPAQVAPTAETFPKPEKSRLEVAIAAWGPTTLPLLVAQEAGYFTRHGLTVSITQVSASAAVQGVVSGAIDIYQGGAAAIAATLAGANIIYVAAGVDRSSLVLFGQKGLTAVEMLRGKSVATTSPGAFGEIAMRMTARKYGMEVGRDLKLLYHRSVQEALGTFQIWKVGGDDLARRLRRDRDAHDGAKVRYGGRAGLEAALSPQRPGGARDFSRRQRRRPHYHSAGDRNRTQAGLSGDRRLLQGRPQDHRSGHGGHARFRAEKSQRAKGVFARLPRRPKTRARRRRVRQEGRRKVRKDQRCAGAERELSAGRARVEQGHDDRPGGDSPRARRFVGSEGEKRRSEDILR